MTYGCIPAQTVRTVRTSAWPTELTVLHRHRTIGESHDEGALMSAAAASLAAMGDQAKLQRARHRGAACANASAGRQSGLKGWRSVFISAPMFTPGLALPRQRGYPTRWLLGAASILDPLRPSSLLSVTV